MAGCTFDASDSLRFPYAYRHPNGSFVEQGQPWGQPWGQPAAGGGGVCVYPAAAAIGATAISLALPRHLCRNAH